jgi:hypothetical protein
VNPIPARRVADYPACLQLGDFFLAGTDEHSQCLRLSFLCPCGCGMLAGIRVVRGGSPYDAATRALGAWGWDGNEDKPTVEPSIDIDHGHWHGYLKDGQFTV